MPTGAELVRWGLTKVLAAIAIVATVTAGCSDKESGNATPATTGGNTTTTTTGQSTSTSGAPKVNNPLDASKYLAQPCAVLSDATLKSLNISKPGKPDTDSQVAKTAGPFCSWLS